MKRHTKDREKEREKEGGRGGRLKKISAPGIEDSSEIAAKWRQVRRIKQETIVLRPSLPHRREKKS